MPSIRSALIASLLGGLAGDALAEPRPRLDQPLDSPSLLDSDQLMVDLLIRDTRKLLDAHGIEGVVTGRVKSPASIHAKMRRKGVGVDAIFDRLALRVRVADEADCYRVRDLLEGRHAGIEGERDDYIATPKANGYQSLHSALVTDRGAIAEFQVRTHAMHAHAEHGDAAHWRYKLASGAYAG